MSRNLVKSGEPDALASSLTPRVQAAPSELAHRDAALEGALKRLLAVERPDTDDPRITAARRLPAIAAEFAAHPEALDPGIGAVLSARGLCRLYSHQAEALDHALAGRNVVVITPTASGKTLCYNAPVLRRDVCRIRRRGRSTCFRPRRSRRTSSPSCTALVETIDARTDVEIGVFTYDGDTPQDARRAIRTRAHVVLSNPDMLHAGILPHHPRWAKLFENLRFVVIDELHAYRGVFGSHLANVLRRLRRICRHYGSIPVFICSSATIANPRELAEAADRRSRSSWWTRAARRAARSFSCSSTRRW